MKKYRFHWRDGSINEGEGDTPEDAFTHLEKRDKRVSE